jgi:hypothetical protein
MEPTANQKTFIQEMRNAGFRMNWLTFLDGTTHPTVYGSFLAVRDKTSVPIQWKPMGNFQVVYPVPENMHSFH